MVAASDDPNQGECFRAGSLGTTTEGKVVVTGIYKFYSTHGIPLDVIFFSLQQRDMVPDWLDFFDQAISIGGMKPEKVLVFSKPP